MWPSTMLWHFFSWWDAEEQDTTSTWNFFDVPHRKFFSIWSTGCFSSISLWSGPRTTVCYFCKSAMRKVDRFILLCDASSCREQLRGAAAGTMLSARSCASLQDRYAAPSNVFRKSTLSWFLVLKFWVPEGQHPKRALVQWKRMMVTLGDRRDGLGELEVQPGWASSVTGGFHSYQEYIKAWLIHLSEVSHSWFICQDRWRAA